MRRPTALALSLQLVFSATVFNILNMLFISYVYGHAHYKIDQLVSLKSLLCALVELFDKSI
jgi:hypothetical protein